MELVMSVTSESAVKVSTEGKYLLTISELCHVLNVGRTKAFELMHDGELRPVRIGKLLRFRVSEVEQFVAGLPYERETKHRSV